MSMISEHLKSEIIDPALPRDSFVPPDYMGDDEDLFDDIDPADIIDVEYEHVE